MSSVYSLTKTTLFAHLTQCYILSLTGHQTSSLLLPLNLGQSKDFQVLIVFNFEIGLTFYDNVTKCSIWRSSQTMVTLY
jgi:hypothetical protein